MYSLEVWEPGPHVFEKDATENVQGQEGEGVPEAIRIAKELGAEIYPIRGNHVSICYSQVKKYVELLGGEILPFGLECIESVNAVAEEARSVLGYLVIIPQW